MGFGTEKTVRTFKAGVHTFEIEEAVVKHNTYKGSAFLNLKRCLCVDRKGRDVGRTIENQLLPFLFMVKGEPNDKNDGASIRDTFYFLVSVCGLGYLDFDSDEMEKDEAFHKACDVLLDNADEISSDLEGKVFKARVIDGTDRDGAECSNFAKGSFSAVVEKKDVKGDSGKTEDNGDDDENESTKGAAQGGKKTKSVNKVETINDDELDDDF